MSSKALLLIVLMFIGISGVYSRINDSDTDTGDSAKEKLYNCGREGFNNTHILQYRAYIDQYVAFLDLGDQCNLTDKVINYQDALELLAKDEPKFEDLDEKTELEAGQMHRICEAMFDIIEEGSAGSQICNSSALLYCKPIDENGASEYGICQCLEQFEEDNYGFKDITAKNCVIKQGDKCGASWTRTGLNEVQGFPESSPKCDTQRCVKNSDSSVEKYECTDDEVGLTLLMVLKDSLDVVSDSDRSWASRLPTSNCLLLLGWIVFHFTSYLP